MSLLSKHAEDFIDDNLILSQIHKKTDKIQFEDVIAKSLSKEPLTVDECAVLLNADKPDEIERIYDAAHKLKRSVYGNRIVLFAPLYIGNYCINECLYCGFRRSNMDAVRRTLSIDEIRQEVMALEDMGQKRLILVFGEHPDYSAEFIADCVRTVYDTRKGHGEIRRVNINAAPLSIQDFKTVKKAGIGTYQVFQESYHHETYASMHPAHTPKGDYMWRLDALSRAMEAGIDDVGIGALFGLTDWRFEVLGLVTHALHLKKVYGVGPHTISFPRLQPASGVHLKENTLVNDADFKRLVAILRLSVPYTGMILTCRESEEIRREVLAFGVSQIDAGTRLELGGYAVNKNAIGQTKEREQFQLGDMRSLDEVTRELMVDGYIPSFCTACYRLGRTGEVFMEFAIPGFIEKFCTPNALTTLQEFLTDYASAATRETGEKLIKEQLEKLEDQTIRDRVEKDLNLIRKTEQRDFYR
jgi:2-iminoacetate synthase